MVGMDAQTGRAIGGLAHIRQSIAIILGTPVGTRVERREFGLDAIETGGRLKAGATAHDVEQAARAALARYEPRIDLQRVQVTIAGSGKFVDSIKVAYRVKETGEIDAIDVHFPS